MRNCLMGVSILLFYTAPVPAQEDAAAVVKKAIEARWWRGRPQQIQGWLLQIQGRNQRPQHGPGLHWRNHLSAAGQV